MHAHAIGLQTNCIVAVLVHVVEAARIPSVYPMGSHPCIKNKALVLAHPTCLLASRGAASASSRSGDFMMCFMYLPWQSTGATVSPFLLSSYTKDCSWQVH